MSDTIKIVEVNGTEWTLRGFVDRGTPSHSEQHTLAMSREGDETPTEFDYVEVDAATNVVTYLSEIGEMVQFPFNVWNEHSGEELEIEESDSAEDAFYPETTDTELANIQAQADIVLSGEDLEIISSADENLRAATDESAVDDGGPYNEPVNPEAGDNSEDNSDEAEEEKETLTLEDVIDEIKESVRAEVMEEAKAAGTAAAQEEFQRLQDAHASFSRIQEEASSDLDPNARKLLDMMLESFSGMVTQRSVRRGEAVKNILVVMVQEFAKSKGSPLRTQTVNPRIIDNPDMWEVNHMIEIGKAIVGEFVHDYTQFTRMSSEFNVMARKMAEMTARETNLATELRAERATNARLMQTGRTGDSSGRMIEDLNTQILNLRKQIEKLRGQVLPTKPKFLIYDPNRGYAFANHATGRTWWNHDIVSDPDALCQFADAPTATRAAALLRTAAATKDTLAYIVRVDIVKAMDEPVIATGKFRSEAAANIPAVSPESFGTVVDDGDANILAEVQPDDDDVSEGEDHIISDDEMTEERDFSEGPEIEEDDSEEAEPVRTVKPAPGKVSLTKPKPTQTVKPAVAKPAPKPASAPVSSKAKQAPKKLGAGFRLGRGR